MPFYQFNFNFNANTEHCIKHFAQINKRNYKLATTKCEDWRNVSKNKEQTHSKKKSNTPPAPTSEEFQHSKRLAMSELSIQGILNFIFFNFFYIPQL